ncbi:MAG: response regulator transcription factor [Sandaracinaceae bacterium]|nr:response regulator transcription factor [Myxococcales bacterium]MCB9656577.1 response regulator transcription factor [Sandaracinaceae bacterium]
MFSSCCCVIADVALHGALQNEFASEPVLLRYVATGREALAMTLEPPVVFLVASPLPDMSTSEFLRRLREGNHGSEPLVLVLGREIDEIDRIVAFELGADDLVQQPVPRREIALRIRALLRRSKAPTPSVDVVSAGRLQIDVPQHTVTFDGAPLDLTAMEFRLLAHLARHSGMVLSRARLLDEVWNHPDSLDRRTVDTHIKRLREKLGGASRVLETVRGFGYRFRGDALEGETAATERSHSRAHSVPG